jgi:hypothetical protein
MATRKISDEGAESRPNGEPLTENLEIASTLNAVELQNAQHREQISELRELVNSLALAVQASQARNAQNEEIRGAVNEIRQTARAISVGAPAAAPRVEQAGARGECGCDCTSSDCCTFKIMLQQVRATRPQIEPPDVGDVPLLQNALECRIYVTADDVGVLIPSLASTLDLRADGLPPGPGPAVVLKREINRIQVRKGTTRIVQLRGEVEEDDTRAGEQALLAGKNEHGEATGTIALNCCMEEIYPSGPLDVDLRYGGEGRGAVQLMIVAQRVCC